MISSDYPASDRIVTDADLRDQLPVLAEELGIGGSGSGIEEVSGTVVLDSSGPSVREFWSVSATTFKANGVDTLISSATGTVWRRTSSGSWGFQQVPEQWTTPAAEPAPAPQPTQVTPAAPTFDDAADTYTIPSTTGVDYLVGGSVVTQGVKTYSDTDTDVTVTAQAKSGYTLTGTTSWTLDFTKKTVAPQWSTLATDTFDGAHGAALAGRTSTTGGLTWASHSGAVTLDGGGAAVFDTHGSSAFHRLVAPTAGTRARYTLQYDLSAHTTTGSKSLVGVGPLTNSAGNNWVTVTIQSDGLLGIVDNAAGAWTISGTTTGHPATGTLVVDFDAAGKTGTVSISGTQVATVTGDTALSIYGVMLQHANSTAKALDLKVERYA